MGLIQREIERAGIPTIGVSIVRAITEKVRPPRTVFLDWPFGHPFGQPFEVDRHRAVIEAALAALYLIDEPGRIVDLPWPWKGEMPPTLPRPRPWESGATIGPSGGL